MFLFFAVSRLNNIYMKMFSCSADTRPGLGRPKLGKRKSAPAPKPARVPEKSLRVQARETLEAGLRRSIGEENKGFRMLQKMGFQPGSTLGKVTGGPKRTDNNCNSLGPGRCSYNLESLSHPSLGWLFSVHFCCICHRNNFCLACQNRFS